jgi:uridine kinase
MNSFIIGLLGPSGSGKTTFCKKICALAEKNVTQLNFDHYYKDQSHLPPEERKLLNFDHPDIIDIELLLEHLNTLKQQQPILRPTYSFADHTRSSSETTTIQPAPIIIIEGLLLFAFPKLRAMLDLSIYLDTPLELCLERRIQRDMAERQRSRASIEQQYRTQVLPMAEKYIIPFRDQADRILNLNMPLEETKMLTELQTIIQEHANPRACMQIPQTASPRAAATLHTPAPSTELFYDERRTAIEFALLNLGTEPDLPIKR